jgi:hypothetical protein
MFAYFRLRPQFNFHFEINEEVAVQSNKNIVDGARDKLEATYSHQA